MASMVSPIILSDLYYLLGPVCNFRARYMFEKYYLSYFSYHEGDFPPPFLMLALGMKLPFFAKSSRVISSASRNLEPLALTTPSFLKVRGYISATSW